MNHNTQGVARNGNQGGSGQARLESATGSQSLGNFRQNPQTLGAGAASTSRSRHDQAAGDHRSRSVGGQASGPGLFGIAGRPRCHAESAPAARHALTAPATRPVTAPAAGLALAMPKCWQPAVTPAMRQAAAAADELERFTEPSLEEWERPASWGQTDITLAIEG